jgi:hypothetical protein
LIHATIDGTLSSAPPPLAESTGANAWLIRSMPKKFVSRCRRAISSLSGAEAADLADAGVVDDERHVAGTCRGRSHCRASSRQADRLDAGLGDGRDARTGVDLARRGRERARERGPMPRLAPVTRATALSIFMESLLGASEKMNMTYVIFEGERGRIGYLPGCAG